MVRRRAIRSRWNRARAWIPTRPRPPLMSPPAPAEQPVGQVPSNRHRRGPTAAGERRSTSGVVARRSRRRSGSSWRCCRCRPQTAAKLALVSAASGNRASSTTWPLALLIVPLMLITDLPAGHGAVTEPAEGRVDAPVTAMRCSPAITFEQIAYAVTLQFGAVPRLVLERVDRDGGQRGVRQLPVEQHLSRGARDLGAVAEQTLARRTRRGDALVDRVRALVAVTSSSPTGAGAQITNACRYQSAGVPASSSAACTVTLLSVASGRIESISTCPFPGVSAPAPTHPLARRARRRDALGRRRARRERCNPLEPYEQPLRAPPGRRVRKGEDEGRLPCVHRVQLLPDRRMVQRPSHAARLR